MLVDHSIPAPLSSTSKHRGRSTTLETSTLLDATTLPACAQTCTIYHIHEGFPRCDATDLACLCSNYSTEGYTLGEIALICLSSQCSQPSDSERGDAYNACVNHSTAVKATHTVLSAGSLPTITSTSVPTKSVSASTTITTTAVATSIPSTTASASSLVEQSHGSTTLSTAQAIGISVAALGVLIAAIAGFYFAAYLRRRKASRPKDQRHSYDFADNAPARFSPFKHGFVGHQGPPGGSTMLPSALPSEKHQTAWPVAQPQRFREKGPDRSPRTARSTSQESLRSDCSMRTVSQLLPARPGSRPQSPKKSPQLSSMNTPATVFEEHSSPVIPSVLYPGLPAHPAAFKEHHPQYAQQYPRSPEQARLPALSLSIPGRPYTVTEANVATNFELLPPPPAGMSNSNGRCDSAADSTHRSSSHSLLKYYASVDSGSPEDLYSATPIEEQTQVRRPPPIAITVTKPLFTPHAVRTSTASDASRRTSFESTDPDEPTPPEEEDKRLTPVAESPIAAIRYPKVPRSCNQSVPRSPNHQRSPKSVEWAATRHQLHEGQIYSRHSPSPSGSTLAAKRRGNTVQQDLELGLKIHGSAYGSPSRKNSQQAHSVSQAQKVHPHHRQENRLQGYGRAANKMQRDAGWPLPTTAEAAAKSPPLKSPLWEPKLTPRREGDDLYLSVSIATPLDAHFRR